MVTFYKEKAYAAYLAEQKVLRELSQETYLKVVRDFFHSLKLRAVVIRMCRLSTMLPNMRSDFI